MKKQLQDYLQSLIGKYVKFYFGRKKIYGRVCSINDGIANIRGIEQPMRVPCAYHVSYESLVICSHDEVYKIGNGQIQNI